MATPNPTEVKQGRRSMLGVAAYVLVPGERRKKAAGHFRRAGFEVLRGFGALARPEREDGGDLAGEVEHASPLESDQV